MWRRAVCPGSMRHFVSGHSCTPQLYILHVTSVPLLHIKLLSCGKGLAVSAETCWSAGCQGSPLRASRGWYGCKARYLSFYGAF